MTENQRMGHCLKTSSPQRVVKVEDDSKERVGDTGCLCVCNNADLPKIAAKNWCYACAIIDIIPFLINKFLPQWASKVNLSILSTNCRLEQTYFR